MLLPTRAVNLELGPMFLPSRQTEPAALRGQRRSGFHCSPIGHSCGSATHSQGMPRNHSRQRPSLPQGSLPCGTRTVDCSKKLHEAGAGLANVVEGLLLQELKAAVLRLPYEIDALSTVEHD